MVADTNREPVRALFESSEAKGWMMGIPLPEAVVLNRQFPDLGRQGVKQFPKLTVATDFTSEAATHVGAPRQIRFRMRV